MNTHNQVELAFNLWINNDREGFKNIIAKEKDNILNYKGRGDISTYFLPALLIENLWADLEAINFPLEKIVYSEPEIVAWLEWEQAVKYMYKKDPEYINDFIEEGLTEEQEFPMSFYKDHENYEIILSYYNSGMRELMENNMESYINRTEEEWELILDNLPLILK